MKLFWRKTVLASAEVLKELENLTATGTFSTVLASSTCRACCLPGGAVWVLK
jgi:hypothetical protein